MSELASSLSWAVMTAARRHGVVIDSVRLNAAITQSMVKSGAAAIDINSLCAALSLPKSQHLAKPDRAQLPMLGVVRERGWGVIADQRPDGRWIFISEEGHALVSDSDLSEGTYKLDFAPLGNKPDQHGFERVFKEALGEYRPIILEVVIASVVMSVIALGASVFSMQVYDRVIPTHGVATLIVLAIGVSLAIVFELGMKFARSHIMDSVVSGLDAKLSQALFERLLSVRVDQLPGSVGSLAGQLRGYEQIRSFYTSQTLFTLVDLPLGLLFVLVIAFIASPWMALVPTVFGLAAIGIGYLSNRKVIRLADKSAAASNLKTGLLVETVEGVETIKSGSGGWKFLSRWIDVSAESIRSDMAMRAIGDHAGYIAAMLQQLSYSTTVIVGSFLVINGQITMGALIACSILGGRILAPVAMIPGLMVQRAHTKATLAGLEKIYALQTDQGNERQLTPDTLRGEFRVEEVKFTYAGSLLNAMSIDQLSIRAGERVAILGPIGAGKSTILRLLSGLYRPQQGRILIDGLDMANINRLTLNQHIGYLQQDHRLFVGTLRENLLIGLPDPGDEVLRQVMERTGLLRLVSAHPKGLDLPIQEGGRGLSGGQRQLVAFTRLLLCRPDIFLLDEPTASMDEDLERHCLGVLNEEISGGRTLVVVTHKPAFLPMVERVIVVVGNRIVLDGPRDAVLGTTFSMVHQGGPYAKGESFKFTSPDGKQLLLSALDGFYAANTDVFSYKTPSGSQQYDIGNVRLLYQVTTENPNSLPTLRVSYDGTKASAGDVIGLYEGSQLIGSRTLTAADVGAANMSLEVTSTSSLGAGQHVITPKLSDAAGNVVVGNGVSVTLAAGTASPLLSNLKVNGETPDTQSINDSVTKYAMIDNAPPQTTPAAKQAIGERLKATRQLSGLNQRDFASRLGTSGAYISCVELGHSMPGGRFLRSLHREFDVNIYWLLTGLEQELPPRHGFHIKVLIGDYVRASERGKSLVMAVASFLVSRRG